MDKWKRGLALLICLLMLSSLAPTAYAVHTGDVDIPAGDIFAEEIPVGLQYVIVGATATVTGYTGALTSLTLPESLEGVPLTTIASGALRNTQLISVTVPNCVTWIEPGALACGTMDAIWVDEGNSAYCSDADGVVYNKSMTTLIQLPGAFAGSFFLPETVQRIQSGALTDCKQLTAVFSTTPGVILSEPESASAVGFHFGYQDGLCVDGCIRCPDCNSWFTPEGAAAPNHYNVSFLDQNGVELSSQILPEGTSLLPPQITERFEDQTYRYGFAGWDREVTPVTADVVYTATYEILGLTGDFNEDGAVSQRDALHLLRYCLGMPNYSLSHCGDMNDDGITFDADAVYLLRFTLFPHRYPLHPKL